MYGTPIRVDVAPVSVLRSPNANSKAPPPVCCFRDLSGIPFEVRSVASYESSLPHVRRSSASLPFEVTERVRGGPSLLLKTPAGSLPELDIPVYQLDQLNPSYPP